MDLSPTPYIPSVEEAGSVSSRAEALPWTRVSGWESGQGRWEATLAGKVSWFVSWLGEEVAPPNCRCKDVGCSQSLPTLRRNLTAPRRTPTPSCPPQGGRLALREFNSEGKTELPGKQPWKSPGS